MNERRENCGARPLHEAARACDERFVALLLAAGAEVDAETDNGSTPLHWASNSDRESIACVSLLLEAGADATLQNRQGFTPLHRAAYGGNASVAKALIAAGADPNVKFLEDAVHYGGSPYAMALDQGHRRVLRVLLQHGAVPDAHIPCRRRHGSFKRARLYHDRVVAAGGYDALVKQHRKILASVVGKVVEAKFGRRAPREVCAHVVTFWTPPGGF